MEDTTDLSDVNENGETEQNESQIFKSTEIDTACHSIDASNVLEELIEILPENPSTFEENSDRENIENEAKIVEKSEITIDDLIIESTLDANNENIENSQTADATESNISVSENYENATSFNNSTKDEPSLVTEEPNESQFTLSNNIDNTETEIDEKHEDGSHENMANTNNDSAKNEMDEKRDEIINENETGVNNVVARSEIDENHEDEIDENDANTNNDSAENEMDEKRDEVINKNETYLNNEDAGIEMDEKRDDKRNGNEANTNYDSAENEIDENQDRKRNETQTLNSEGLKIHENLVEKDTSNEEIEESLRIHTEENSNQTEHDKSVNASLECKQEPDIMNKDFENTSNKTKITQKLDGVSSFFTVHIQLDDGTVKNQIVTVVKAKGKKPFLGGYRHKLSGIEYHNAAIQTRPKPRPPPSVDLFSRDTQTFQIKHQKTNTNNTTSTQMTKPGLFVSNETDTLIVPGKYETADEYQERILKNIITIQKYYRRWLAKHIVNEKRRQRDERLQWEQNDTELKMKEKEERIKKEYERRMHPKTRADFDLLYNGLEKWRQSELAKIDGNDKSLAEKKAEKLALLEEETDLLAAIDRHKIDRKQQSKSEEVQKLLGKAAAPKSWKDNKGRRIQMDTPYTIRSRELLDILNSLNMQYLTQDERLDVLLTLKHTVKEHDCKLTRDIIDLVDREADLIMRNTKDNNLAGLRKRIITLFLQYCKTPTFNPEISLLLKVPPDPTVLIGDINYCKYCGKYLRSVEFSLSTKSSKLTICKSCARKENQSRKRQDYSHYRRILKDLQMEEQEINDESKIAFIFKQNDIKTLMEGVWDNKSILSECEDLDELVFVRWNFREHWSPWNTILMTKNEAEAHRKVINTSEIYSDVMINRINQKHVIARNMFEALEKMIEKENNNNNTKPAIKV